MHLGNDQVVFMIFTAVTSLGVLLQAFVLLGIFLAVRKTATRLTAMAEEARLATLPVLAISRNVLEDISPKIKVIVTNLMHTSNTLRSQANHVNDTVGDIVDKSRAQAARVDEMVSGTLDTIEHATQAIQHGVSVPIRQIAGMLNAFRAGFDVLRKREPAERETADSDMFV